MTAPPWKTSTAGARIRVALWLSSEVRVGGVFTKAQLRGAFPGVEQIDRRMRDLRSEGWVIHTYREDRSLLVDELRLVAIGAQVWAPHYRQRRGTAVSDKERQAIFVADNYACVCCGIAGGEPYPDDLARTAKLTLSRAALSADAGPPRLRTLCDRCHVSTHDATPGSEEAFIREINALGGPERQRLCRWVLGGHRPPAREEELWVRYRRLPYAVRESIRVQLANGIEPGELA